MMQLLSKEFLERVQLLALPLLERVSLHWM
jgi:hypothetical protein